MSRIERVQRGVQDRKSTEACPGKKEYRGVSRIEGVQRRVQDRKSPEACLGYKESRGMFRIERVQRGVQESKEACPGVFSSLGDSIFEGELRGQKYFH